MLFAIRILNRPFIHEIGFVQILSLLLSLRKLGKRTQGETPELV